MPTLSIFYGIIVRMLVENNGKHNLPHIHAKYNEYEAAVTLDGIVLEGSLPKKQMNLLQAWISIHEEDLKANWETLTTTGDYCKIEPLR